MYKRQSSSIPFILRAERKLTQSERETRTTCTQGRGGERRGKAESPGGQTSRSETPEIEHQQPRTWRNEGEELC